MVVTRIKEDTACRVSRTGAGSEQVLKIAVKKKNSNFCAIVSHYCGDGLIYLFLISFGSHSLAPQPTFGIIQLSKF